MPAVGIIAPRRRDHLAQSVAWGLITFAFTLAIGLRHQIGVDWFTYLRQFHLVATAGFSAALAWHDPGYYAINWLANWLGVGIYGVNLACGAVLMVGVIAFARRQPFPWLALYVAVPYLIIVVGMGYTRQSASLGFLLLGLAALAEKHIVRFVLCVLLGALFHSTAVLVLPLAALASTRHRLWQFAWVGAVALLAAYLFLLDSAERYWVNYVEADYSSEGGLIRVTMNAVPAAILILFRRHLRLSHDDRRLWGWMSWFALACIPLVLLSSTATDRMALYLMPIQMFVFSRLQLLARQPSLRALIVLGVIVYYALVQYIWLNFAVHAFAWVPYRVAWPF